MSKVNYYTVEKEINGKKYVAQFNGVGAALEAIDSCQNNNNSNVSTVKLSKYLFKNVIVTPTNLTADDFETVEEFNEVVTFANEVMMGHFRDKKVDDKSAETKGEE